MNTIDKTYYQYLVTFFSHKRPHGSGSEAHWIQTHILNELNTQGIKWHFDDARNIHIDRRNTTNHKPSRTLFVAHTDTVHSSEGRQVVYIGNQQVMQVLDENANCLGADDGAGVLVLLALILNDVPGYYIFTRGEERGGIGSSHLAMQQFDLLSEFDRAIAFDRKGTSSVITHQAYGRCCSDVFADALSDALSNDELMYAPDATGVYTDTAEFINVIPECTNVSVGYMNEHTTNESLDLRHLGALIRRCIQIDWEALPTARDPLEDELRDNQMWWEGYKDDFGIGGVYGKATYNDFNMMAYDTCVQAYRGNSDAFLWMVAEAVNPADPDEVYRDIWSAKIPDNVLLQCMKDLDHAEDDVQTMQALLSVYDYMGVMR